MPVAAIRTPLSGTLGVLVGIELTGDNRVLQYSTVYWCVFSVTTILTEV